MTSPKFANDEGGSRHYAVPGYDVKFRSSTSTLGVLAKPALPAWSAKLAAQYAVEHEELWHAIQQEAGNEEAVRLIAGTARRYTDAASNLGTRVHAACENYARYGLTDGCSSDVAPYLEQFVKFCNEQKPTFIHVERTVINVDHAYAGTLDMAVTLPNKRGVFIGDIKSGKNVYAEAAPQMCSYARATHMIVDDAAVPVEWDIAGAFVLHLRPRSYKMLWCDISDSTWEMFLHCLALREWQDGCGKDALCAVSVDDAA